MLVKILSARRSLLVVIVALVVTCAGLMLGRTSSSGAAATAPVTVTFPGNTTTLHFAHMSALTSEAVPNTLVTTGGALGKPQPPTVTLVKTLAANDAAQRFALDWQAAAVSTTQAALDTAITLTNSSGTIASYFLTNAWPTSVKVTQIGTVTTLTVTLVAESFRVLP